MVNNANNTNIFLTFFFCFLDLNGVLPIRDTFGSPGKVVFKEINSFNRILMLNVNVNLFLVTVFAILCICSVSTCQCTHIVLVASRTSVTLWC